jgi:hypothetical protein
MFVELRFDLRLEGRSDFVESGARFLPQGHQVFPSEAIHPDPLFLDWYQGSQQSLFGPALAHLLSSRQQLPFPQPASNPYAQLPGSHLHLNPYSTFSGEGKAEESSLLSFAARNPFVANPASGYSSLPGLLQGQFPATGLAHFSDPIREFSAQRSGLPSSLSSLYQPGTTLGNLSHGLSHISPPFSLRESGALLSASLDQIRRGPSHSLDVHNMPPSNSLVSNVASARAIIGLPASQNVPSLSGVDPMTLSEDALASALVSHIRSRGGFGSTENIPWELPVPLSLPEDNDKLSPFQILLRNQIEVFKASGEDTSTHTRGRNKPISLGQVGIRCRHCANLPVKRRQKGATYYPSTIMGIYQAAQNMSVTHLQEGSCNEMPEDVKQEFERLVSTKATSTGAGRPYWAQAAKQLGLIDTDDGIRFIRDFPSFG